jgi:hypothetical protein
MTFREKILALYERFQYVQKSGNNAHFKYKFFEESAIKGKFNLACRELGLIVTRTTLIPVGECSGKACVVMLTMRIEDAAGSPTGESIELTGIGGGMDSGDKAPMKAEVSAYKYAIANGLSVRTGNDPEADGSTDQSALDGVHERIAAAQDRGQLEMCKPLIAALKGIEGFDELKDAFKLRAKTLDGVDKA